MATTLMSFSRWVRFVTVGLVLVIGGCGGGGGSSSNSSAALQSIAVTPADTSTAIGKTQQFTATGTYSDASTKGITSSVTWSSSSASNATIDPSGLATGVASGTSTITATSGSVTGATTLTVALTLTSNQSVIQTITNSDGSTCDQVTRDTTSCLSARQSLGLSGNWLNFSCDVELGLADSSKASTTNYSSATYITVTTHGMPDHTSNYYPTTGAYSFTANGSTYAGNFSDMHLSYTPKFPDPNSIADATNEILYIPKTPTKATTKQVMPAGTIGVAVDGTIIYNNQANSTDNIFAEAGSFDTCKGHPSGDSRYHYHVEPLSITDNDNKLIGVFLDGYFLYGRQDNDGTVPGTIANVEAAGNTSDIYVYGGHVGSDPLIGTGSTFHYHATEWEGCYDETHLSGKAADDGETNDTFNTAASCAGTWVDSWFLTGHGNGGVYMTIPSGLSGQSPSQTVAGKRYYYGTPGSCGGCTGTVK